MSPAEDLRALANAIDSRLQKAERDRHRLEVERDAARDVCADLRAEVARLQAQIKRREADLRARHGFTPTDTSRMHWECLGLARFWRLRDRWNARAYINDARALRLSDPTFAGRLP